MPDHLPFPANWDWSIDSETQRPMLMASGYGCATIPVTVYVPAEVYGLTDWENERAATELTHRLNAYDSMREALESVDRAISSNLPYSVLRQVKQNLDIDKALAKARGELDE